MVFTGMRAAPPTRRHLRHWEAVCHALDAQPYRAVPYRSADVRTPVKAHGPV